MKEEKEEREAVRDRKKQCSHRNQHCMVTNFRDTI